MKVKAFKKSLSLLLCLVMLLPTLPFSAVAQEATYTLTFIDRYMLDPETREYPVRTVTVSAGEYTLPADDFKVLDGYTFDRWDIDTDGDGEYEAYAVGDVINVGHDLEIYIERKALPSVAYALFKVCAPEEYRYGMRAGSISVGIEDAPHITICEGGYGHGYYLEGSEILSADDTLSTSDSYSLYVCFRIEEGYLNYIIGTNVDLCGDSVFDGLKASSDPVELEDGSYRIRFDLPRAHGEDLTAEKLLFSVDGYSKGKKITDISADSVTEHISITGSGYGSVYEGHSYMIWRDSFGYGNGVFDGSGVFESSRDYYIQIGFSVEDGYSIPEDFFDGRIFDGNKVGIAGMDDAQFYSSGENSGGYYVVFRLPQIETVPIDKIEFEIDGYTAGEPVYNVSVTCSENLRFPEGGYYVAYLFYDDSYYDYGFGGDFAPVNYDAVIEKGILYKLSVRIFPDDGYDADSLECSDVTLKTPNGTVSATRFQKDERFDYFWVTFDLPPILPTVSFDGDGASGEMKSASVYGVYTLPRCSFTAPFGQMFGGWSVDGKLYRPGDTVTVLEDTVVKAVWQREPLITYKVAFNANGGSGTMKNVRGVVGEYILPSCSFAPPTELESFAGWRLNDTNIILVPGTALRITDDTVLTATWRTRDLSSYSVVFDANGGEGAYGPASFVVGSYTLPECPFYAPAGMRFKAWMVDGIEYAPGEGINVFANKKVTAVWEDVYVVTFKANGGEGEMAPVLMSAGELTLPECAFTPQWGFGFSHWNGISCTYDPGDTIEVSRNMSFTAVYESHTTYVNIRGEVTSFGSPEESVTITLYKEVETEPFLREVKSGNSVTYNFPYVEAGTYVLTVQKAGHVDYRATVYTSLSDVTHNVDLEMNPSEVLLGDINLDGSVSAKDSNLMKRVIAGVNDYKAGSAEFAAADIDGDGNISAKDANLLKQIIAGTLDMG